MQPWVAGQQDSSDETAGQQLVKLLSLHEALSSMALEGKHAKQKRPAEGQTQVIGSLHDRSTVC